MRFLVTFFVLVSALFAQDTRDMKRSGAQQLQFRDSYIMPILSAVMEKKLPYTKINDRVRKQDKLIAERFGGKKVHITLRGFYSPLSPMVRMAAGVEANGEPDVIVYNTGHHGSIRSDFV